MGLFARLRSLILSGRSERDLADELASHLEFQVRKHRAAGMSETEARRLARSEFGGLEIAKEQCREIDRWRSIDIAARNLKYALRSLVRSPAFSLAAVGILALGIAANLTAFNLVNALLLRPLPVASPGQLVHIRAVDPEGKPSNYLPSTVLDPLERDAAFQGVCGFETSHGGANLKGVVRSVDKLILSGDCFSALGIPMQFGRPLGASDDRIGAAPVAVISASIWRGAFGGRPDVLGERIDMPDASYTIVGVTGERFTGLSAAVLADVMIPLWQQPMQLPGGQKPAYYMIQALARRARGVSESQAQASLDAQRSTLLEQSIPRRYNGQRRNQYLASRLVLESAKTGVDDFLRRRFGDSLLAMLGICAAILAIACVNLANLLLARGMRRRREIAVRLAIGARLSHVAAMLATESSILVLTGAAIGGALSLWLGRSIASESAGMFQTINLNLTLDWRAALFLACAAALIAAGFAGMLAWQTARLSNLAAASGGGRGATHGSGPAQRALIVCQIAITLALLVGGSLFGASLRSLYQVDLGVTTRNVWDAILSARPGGGDNFAPNPYYHDLLLRIEGLPGVTSATLTNDIPFFNRARDTTVSLVEGSTAGSQIQAQDLRVTDGFFQTLGIRIAAGADFRRDEDAAAEPEAIVSQSLADRLADSRALVGRHIRVGTPGAERVFLVRGIASNAMLDLVDPTRQKPFNVYLDFWQHPAEQAGYPVALIKTTGGSLAADMVRRAVDSAGREYIDRLSPLDAEKDGALVENRAVAYAGGIFAALALALAATGLFGLLSYQVTDRTGEIGIRMALGARRGQIQWLIVRQALLLAAVGCAAGVALSMIASKAIAGLLFGVGAYDPRIFAVAFAALAVTALIAAWLPARRASSVDPLSALRQVG